LPEVSGLMTSSGVTHYLAPGRRIILRSLFFGRSRSVLCVRSESPSRISDNFPFRHGGRVDVGLPHDPRVDVGMMLLQPVRQDLRCVAQARAVRKQHDTAGIAQRLGDPVVERQVFRCALPLFALLIAVVQMMKEMMRILRLECFAMLI
jgi:hypothetical protein